MTARRLLGTKSGIETSPDDWHVSTGLRWSSPMRDIEELDELLGSRQSNSSAIFSASPCFSTIQKSGYSLTTTSTSCATCCGATASGLVASGPHSIAFPKAGSRHRV